MISGLVLEINKTSLTSVQLSPFPGSEVVDELLLHWRQQTHVVVRFAKFGSERRSIRRAQRCGHCRHVGKKGRCSDLCPLDSGPLFARLLAFKVPYSALSQNFERAIFISFGTLQSAISSSL